MNQCRQHGARLPDGTRVGHYWIVTEERTANGSAIFRGLCRYCGRVKRFTHHPQSFISETALYTIRTKQYSLGTAKIQPRIHAPVRDGTLTGSFSC